jgi:hypothetical protein
MHDAGFEPLSKPLAWEQHGANADTCAVVTVVPLQNQTYIEVVVMSNERKSRDRWGPELMNRIVDSGLTIIDDDT